MTPCGSRPQCYWFNPLEIIVYTSNMPAKPVQVSIDTELLRRIDSDPEAREKGRSAFVRAAVRFYLTAKERAEVEEGIRRAYEGQADAMVDEVAELIGAQQWPES